MVKEKMKALMDAYKEEPEKKAEVADAQKQMIGFFYAVLSSAVHEKKNGKNENPVDLASAQQAVEKLNGFCKEKQMEPVFTGNIHDAKEVFAFADAFVKGILVADGESAESAGGENQERKTEE